MVPASTIEKGQSSQNELKKSLWLILGVPKSFHGVTYSYSIKFPYISHHLGMETSVNINPYLDSYGHQLILRGFVEQDEGGHQVLLLAINLVGFQSIQEFVVTEEYVSALFEYEITCFKLLGCLWNTFYNNGVPANPGFYDSSIYFCY